MTFGGTVAIARPQLRIPSGLRSLTRSEWLLLITLALSWNGTGNVWLTQLSWSLFAYVSGPNFAAYHQAWWIGVQLFTLPLAILVYVCAIAQLRWRPAGVSAWMAWVGVGMRTAMNILTVVWFGAGQARLTQAVLPDGSLDPFYVQLVQTQWVRVALVTAFALLELWMTIR